MWFVKHSVDIFSRGNCSKDIENLDAKLQMISLDIKNLVGIVVTVIF